MIHVQNVTKFYQRGHTNVDVLRGLTCDFPTGSFNFILGPSGSGKSTLLYLMGALDVPTSGEISVGGRELSRFSRREKDQFRRRDIGFIFQSFNLLKNLNVLDNTLVPFLAEKNVASKRTEAAKLLEQMGLKDRIHHRPSELSGGEQQRVAIARAILKQPQVILADEPTGELDSQTGRIVFEILRTLNQQSGVTVITVTHDERYLSESDRILRIQDGQVLSVQAPSESN